MLSIEQVLCQYAKQIIHRWSESEARKYLRGCYRMWVDEYGQVIADRCGKEIKAEFVKRYGR